MFDIKEETTLRALAECLKLGELHYDEVFAHKKDKVERNYNWQFLKLCLDNHLMHIVTAREGKKIVGYFVNLISPDMFSSTFVAKELAIFVHPEYRGHKLFEQMLKYTEEMLVANAVTSQLLAFQKGFNEELPIRYGYRPTEIVYEKILIEE